jgi:hypothetical protein
MAKKESADERAWFEKEIEAQERDVPPGRPGIKWKRLTHLPVQSRAEAIEKLDWYAMHWKIETFHKILKSGRKAEDSKLRTADRLANLIFVFCILSWRIFWLTMISRCAPQGLLPRTLWSFDREGLTSVSSGFPASACAVRARQGLARPPGTRRCGVVRRARTRGQSV